MAAGDATTLVRFFEKKPGQSLADISHEIHELSEDEIRQLVDGINDGSLNY